MSQKPLLSLMWIVLLAFLIAAPAGADAPQATQRTIPVIEKMPRLPTPYRIRDWKKVTVDYVDFAFDFDRKGPYLPLIRWQDREQSNFFLSSYLGGNGPEAINCLAAVVSGTLVQVDMTRYRQHDWVTLSQAYFSPQDGVYTNNLHGRVSGSAWYDLLPNILFYQLADRYPDVGAARTQFESVAQQWRRACVAMGGKTAPFTLPDFDHTGFRFDTMTPLDNGRWIEPDMAAGIAWLEYMAYARRKAPRSLTAADWCLRALEQRPVEKNPLYEVLLPYGVLAAVRMNAEQGHTYDVRKLLIWCFTAGDQRSARIGWGVIADRFGGYDCSGLIGSVTDTDGYAFAMNTFEWAGALTPVARYDTRYARTIGKWLGNLTSAARLFYPAALPATQQDDRAWADAYDPAGCLPYEGLRHQALRFSSEVVDAGQPSGTVKSGSDTAIHRLDNVTEDLTTVPDAQGAEHLEHLWKILIPDAGACSLEIFARCLVATNAPHGFRFLWSQQRNGDYLPLFEVKETDRIVWHSAPLTHVPRGATIYVKAIAQEGSARETLQVDQIQVRAQDAANAPYATGDARVGGGPSNLCLYGGSHVGLLGALVTQTSDERIPGFDLLATDWFHAPAFPSRLFYNPYNRSRRITFPVGARALDVYDAVTHRFRVRHAVKTATLTLTPDEAVVAVFVPSDGRVVHQGNRRLVNGVVVDYQAGPAPRPSTPGVVAIRIPQR